ncbi:hypothetical protein AX16_005065 [Volvariella volvacea WC 439]|nr:hypothetical protein AX16_005065 [Volvariella volvacea WC 439]
MAAYNRRCDIPALRRVAHRVRLWLEDIAFEIVLLYGDHIECNCDEDAKYGYSGDLPSGPQARHVKQLKAVLGHMLQEGHENLLDQYFNLQNLAIGEDLLPDTLNQLSSIIHSPQRTVSPRGLTRLWIPLSDLFEGEVDFSHEVLQDLTHLEVLDSYSYGMPWWEEGNNYGQLKKLRCLTFADFFPDIISKCLEECESLELIIVLFVGDEEDIPFLEDVPKARRKIKPDGTIEEVPEDRVVFITRDELYKANHCWDGDWVRGALGAEDLWARGEKIVAERRVKKTFDLMDPFLESKNI